MSTANRHRFSQRPIHDSHSWHYAWMQRRVIDAVRQRNQILRAFMLRWKANETHLVCKRRTMEFKSKELKAQLHPKDFPVGMNYSASTSNLSSAFTAMMKSHKSTISAPLKLRNKGINAASLASMEFPAYSLHTPIPIKFLS